jgi:HKD family nuclease
MPFLVSPNDLRAAMIRLGSAATAIDIAVAWATMGPALDELCELVARRHITLRSLVGLDFNQTNPTALDRLRKVGTVRIGVSPTGVFHPKLYLFHGQPPRAIVGSANLTNAAFSGNTEIAIEKALDDSEYDHVRSFFAKQWQASAPLTDELMQEYRKRWRNSPRGATGDMIEDEIANNTSQSPILDIDALAAQLTSWTWDEYRNALVDLERIRVRQDFSVLRSDRHSWLHTARLAWPLARSRLDELERGERGIVFGIHVPTLPPEVEPGYFGNLGSRGSVMQIATGRQGEPMTQFQADSLRYISDALDILGDSALSLEVVGEVYDALNAIQGFGVATNSRLMTLRRPDSIMIVNGANARLMALAFGIPESRIKTRRGYLEAHDILWNTAWWRSEEPSDFADAELWSFRAALVDAFVYEPRDGA